MIHFTFIGLYAGVPYCGNANEKDKYIHAEELNGNILWDGKTNHKIKKHGKQKIFIQKMKQSIILRHNETGNLL